MTWAYDVNTGDTALYSVCIWSLRKSLGNKNALLHTSLPIFTTPSPFPNPALLGLCIAPYPKPICRSLLPTKRK